MMMVVVTAFEVFGLRASEVKAKIMCMATKEEHFVQRYCSWPGVENHRRCCVLQGGISANRGIIVELTRQIPTTWACASSGMSIRLKHITARICA